MKTKILFTLLLIFDYSFSQDTNLGLIAEYNKEIEVQFQLFNPPLKIKRVLEQKNIDYSTIEGIIKSYSSATNSKWVSDEYLDKKTLMSDKK